MKFLISNENFISSISLLISNYYTNFDFNQFPSPSTVTEVLIRYSPFANNTRFFTGLGCVPCSGDFTFPLLHAKIVVAGAFFFVPD